MKSITLMGVLMLASTVTVFAQEEKKEEAPKLLIGGHLDSYFKLDAAGKLGQNSTTSFTRTHNSVELNMATITAEQKFGKAQAFLDLGFGKRVEEFVYNNSVPKNNTFSTIFVKQMFVAYQATDALKLTMGSWGTHIGYEYVDATMNSNYSISYAFTNGPFFNTGVKADYVFRKWNFMTGLTQPSDIRSALDAKTTQKTVIGQIGYTGDKTSFYANFTTGSYNPNNANTTQFDLVVNRKVTDKFTASLHTSINKNTYDDKTKAVYWYTFIGYFKYDLKSNINLTLRSEYFRDKGFTADFGYLNDVNLVSNTLTLNYKIANLTLKPEIRFTSASEKHFLDYDNNPTNKNLQVFFATVYKF